MTAWLRTHIRWVRRLMRAMGWKLQAQYQQACTGTQDIPLPAQRSGSRQGQSGLGRHHLPAHVPDLYLVAIMDWHSRYVLAWRLSNTLEVGFCIAALKEALSKGQPEIFNTDQGSQFTSEAFCGLLLSGGSRSAWMARADTWTTSL